MLPAKNLQHFCTTNETTFCMTRAHHSSVFIMDLPELAIASLIKFSDFAM
ncbi:unnamed protein product [Amoebophrya sp. A25]|nr:unnamed protein product [Amoebophrya sp. A25]|eukprot:GSA25T00009099001.1